MDDGLCYNGRGNKEVKTYINANSLKTPYVLATVQLGKHSNQNNISGLDDHLL